jgi:hypothetical protein
MSQANISWEKYQMRDLAKNFEEIELASPWR